MAKSRKKSGLILILAILLVLGIAGGYLTAFLLTKEDKFEIIGEKRIELEVGQEYIEEGAVAIAFGKDVSKDIKIEGEVNTLAAGEYHIKYTVDNVRYRDVVRYRVVVVVEVADENN